MEKKAPLYKRFYIYQNERFSLLSHGLLISTFTFSAVSYSRICREAEGFIPWSDFLVGIFATITLFFLVRVFDEFKDKEDDAKYRKYLPVPRGLISLLELKRIAWFVGIVQIIIISVFQPQMLLLYVIVIGYLLFMGVEFFVPKWLRKRQIIYITSHMVIIPLVDIYSSGLDWVLSNAEPHFGLAFFFAVSYMNGIVLEFGRKIRHPEGEEEGVISYTGLYGTKGGVIRWLLLLLSTMILAIMAANYAGYGATGLIVIGTLFVVCSVPGILFLRNHTEKLTKLIEHSSGIWSLGMYLSLGAIPMIHNLLGL